MRKLVRPSQTRAPRPQAPLPSDGSENREAMPARATSFATGLSAESKAASYLIARGYRILARRFRCRAGEIDIVASHRGVVVFVEVKARAHLDEAAYAITERQRARIIAAAEAWIAANPDYARQPMRLDAILVPARGKFTHLVSAFDGSA